MLSTFESALLDRHLHRCADCRAFAAGATAQTERLRSAVLERPLHPVVVPAGRRRTTRRVAAGVLTAAASVAAAALVTVTPSGDRSVAPTASSAPQQQIVTGAPVLVVVAAHPTLGSETVPRLKMQPASIADGPVHGLFSTPVVTV